MYHLHSRPGVLFSGGMYAQQVAKDRINPGLVYSDPLFNPVAETPAQQFTVIGKVLYYPPVGKSPVFLLQRLRQIPVKDRREGGNPGLQQLVHQPRVKVEPLLIYPAPT